MMAAAGVWTWPSKPEAVAEASRSSVSCFTPTFGPAAAADAGAAAAAPAATLARIGSATGGGAGAPGGRGMIVLATARMFLSKLLIRLSISFVDFSKLSKTSNRLRTTSMISAGPPCFHGVSPVSSFLLTLHVYCPAGSATVEVFFAGAGFDILQVGLERDKGRGF